MSCLVVTVHFLDGRYHGLEPDGRPEWPPSPARLFQALAAAAARGAGLTEEDMRALEWLETLDPPLVAAPTRHKGRSFSHFMPNNDTDTVGGHPARISEIRSATKRFHPQLFDSDMPFLYRWSFEDGQEHAERICEIALRLYQLGRGVDMAWAVAEILDDKKADDQFATYSGAVHRPSRNGRGRQLACPASGSLESLIERFEKGRVQFTPIIEAAPTKKDPSKKRVAGYTFEQRPKPRFQEVPYDSPAVRLLYELRDMTQEAAFLSWPQTETVRLVETIRNSAATTLADVLPENNAAIVQRAFGLCRNAKGADKASRIRIVPLPSIGHHHADRGIRRVMVEVPPDCGLPAKDIAWSFEATGDVDVATGEVRWMLVAASEQAMLRHYGIGDDIDMGSRTWRTVTPIALPVARPHGKIKGSERVASERDAVRALAQALRHVGIREKPTRIHVQREPLDAKGQRAEVFGKQTRFGSARLWHAEISFSRPISGPVVVGDGRYLGLGLMRPATMAEDVYAFAIKDGLSANVDGLTIARTLRRAVMARVQEHIGPGTPLPLFFTGHEADGAPARRGRRSHLAFSYDSAKRRLLVIAPHRLERREPSFEERQHLTLLDAALCGLRELRAGKAGLLKLESLEIDEARDPLFGHARVWVSQTDYQPTRHAKKTTVEEMIDSDIRLELDRRGIPVPTLVTPINVSQGPRGGLAAQLRLEFSVAVRGPLLLGKTCNFGGGLFCCL